MSDTSYSDTVAAKLEREMGVRNALLYVKQLAEREGISTSGGTSNIIARLATNGVWL